MSKGGKFILETSLDESNNLLFNLGFLDKKLKENSGKIKFLNKIQNYNFSFKKYYKPIIPVAQEWTEEVLSTFTFGGVNNYLLPVYGDFIGEMFIKLNINVKMTSPLDSCFFCDFPGHRIPQLTRLTFSGVTIDEYPADAYNVYYNYFVSENKKKSWLKAVGQEDAIDFKTGFEQRKCLNGLQTQKNSHNITLYIPVLFDFSTRFDKPLFSKPIPFGQRFVELSTADISQIIFPVNNGGGGQYTYTASSSLWINQIFVYQPIITELLKSAYAIPIKTFRYEFFRADANGLKKLDRIRHQIENLFFGAKPNNGPTDWWRFHAYDLKTVYIPAETLNPNPPPIHQLIFQTENIKIPRQIITNVNFKTKDVDLMKQTAPEFYSILQPLCRSISPNDPGILCYSFAESVNVIFEQKKDSYSSFYNINLDKNFYMDFEISAPCDIFVMGRAINKCIISKTGDVRIVYP